MARLRANTVHGQLSCKRLLVKVIVMYKYIYFLKCELVLTEALTRISVHCASYAPWCPACQQLQSVWKEFADWGEDMGVNVAKVDVTEQPGKARRRLKRAGGSFQALNYKRGLTCVSAPAAIFGRRPHRNSLTPFRSVCLNE